MNECPLCTPGSGKEAGHKGRHKGSTGIKGKRVDPALVEEDPPSE
jgi:hypothetical protein